MKCDLLFRGVIFPATDDFSRWEKGDVALDDGIIADLGGDLSYDAAQRVEAQNLVMIPGLFNLHTHGQDMLWRGSREDDGVDRSWPEWFWPTYNSLPEEVQVSAAMAAYLTNAMSGVTFLADHLRHGLPAEPFAEALQRIGLRGYIHSHLAQGAGKPLALPHETAPTFGEAIERASLLERCPIMIHAQETQLRLDAVRQQFQCSTVELLDQYGLLHDRTFLVHLGFFSERDLELIAARRSHIVVTPTAEMKLGEPTFDIVDAKARGLSILVGTDGPAYHNREDLFHDLKLLSLLSSTKYGPGRLKPGEILAMATWKAAEAVGRPRTFIEKGGVADLILLDGHSVGLAPLVRSPFDNVAHQLLHAAAREALRLVVVNGKIIISNHHSLSVDTAEIFDDLRKYLARYFELY